MADANRTYFNKLASEYDSRFEKTITQLVDEIQKRRYFISVDWVEDDDDSDQDDSHHGDGGDGRVDPQAKATVSSDTASVKLLDYACGTGLISRALAQYTSQCVGIDISDKMVAAYNARAENQGLAEGEMHAYHGNLTDPQDPAPAAFAGAEFSGFDVVAVGLGFHHFDDPEYSAKKLVERLKPGGVLFIIDFLPHAPVAGHQHDHRHGGDDSHGHHHGHHHHGQPAVDTNESRHTVMHHGFSEERIKSIFEGAGAGKDFALAELGSGVVFSDSKGQQREMKRQVFLARGVKS